MISRTAVIVATKGRPLELSHLLDALAAQTARPDLIVISACDASDIPQTRASEQNERLIFSSPGSSLQRNRALSEVRGKYDIVVFFDDDFLPSRFWMERVQILLEDRPDVAVVTGRVLADGVRTGGIDWPTARSVVNEADLSVDQSTPYIPEITECKDPYGCNMACRGSKIGDLCFDERLAFYGWLEDRDFAVRVSAGSRMISTNWIWGVHLGATRGRTSGRRFGYSQIVNPWYLMKKGTISRFNACVFVARALARNALGSVLRDEIVDRRGRLQGNLIGVRDLISGNWAPERVARL